MVIQKKPLEGIINIITNLSGVAWKQIVHVPIRRTGGATKGLREVVLFPEPTRKANFDVILHGAP